MSEIQPLENKPAPVVISGANSGLISMDFLPNCLEKGGVLKTPVFEMFPVLVEVSRQ